MAFLLCVAFLCLRWVCGGFGIALLTP
ncbi:hypothetical protein NB510_10545 [Vibrio alginolyticus]|nr:hypothetical protein [Vibrio alginolyticus]